MIGQYLAVERVSTEYQVHTSTFYLCFLHCLNIYLSGIHTCFLRTLQWYRSAPGIKSQARPEFASASPDCRLDILPAAWLLPSCISTFIELSKLRSTCISYSIHTCQVCFQWRNRIFRAVRHGPAAFYYYNYCNNRRDFLPLFRPVVNKRATRILVANTSTDM